MREDAGVPGHDRPIAGTGKGVGGRRAMRRVEGQPIDHGVAFLLGDAPDFISALQEVSGPGSLEWPRTIVGSGTPCQPRAYASGGVRIACSHGVSAFPEYLARGLDVELETDVIGFEATPFAEAGSVSSAMLEMLPTVACATVLALYGVADIEPPRGDIWYPETSQKLLLLSHDSAKRQTPERVALVLQARPAWLAEVASDGSQAWAHHLLEEGASLAGPWVKSPSVVHAHFWHHARTNPDSELSGPVLLRLLNGARVGIPGDFCAPGGGVQVAWQSGRALATQLCEEART